MAIYLTGDTHGNFYRIGRFCHKMQTSNEDVFIILGDAGINYYGDDRDQEKKRYLSSLHITLFCIHGNHERRPATLSSYYEQYWNGGIVYYEKEYPHILFAKDGEVYDFNGLKTIVIGGAYSIDKYYRLSRGYAWFEDEQPSLKIKHDVEKQLENHDWKIDVVLSHTCPRKYEPIEVFLSNINQSSVDTSTEDWLDEIENKLDYKRWFCGHFHTSKTVDRIRFMFEDYMELHTYSK